MSTFFMKYLYIPMLSVRVPFCHRYTFRERRLKDEWMAAKNLFRIKDNNEPAHNIFTNTNSRKTAIPL